MALNPISIRDLAKRNEQSKKDREAEKSKDK